MLLRFAAVRLSTVAVFATVMTMGVMTVVLLVGRGRRLGVSVIFR